jgi:hypothetical protein
VVPAATPTAVVRRLSGEFVKILGIADIRKRLIDQGADVAGGTPADFATFMNEDRSRWGVVVRKPLSSQSEWGSDGSQACPTLCYRRALLRTHRLTSV